MTVYIGSRIHTPQHFDSYKIRGTTSPEIYCINYANQKHTFPVIQRINLYIIFVKVKNFFLYSPFTYRNTYFLRIFVHIAENICTHIKILFLHGKKLTDTVIYAVMTETFPGRESSFVLFILAYILFL